MHVGVILIKCECMRDKDFSKDTGEVLLLHVSHSFISTEISLSLLAISCSGACPCNSILKLLQHVPKSRVIDKIQLIYFKFFDFFSVLVFDIYRRGRKEISL